MENFAKILEFALSKSENEFISIIQDYLEPLTKEKLDLFASILENGSVVDKKCIAKLFIEKLGTTGAAFLTDKLSPDRPKLFTESAEILSALEYEKAIIPLSKAISSETPDLVLPAIKAISTFANNKKATEILKNFYLEFPDEVKLSKAIKYLTNIKEQLTPEFLSVYKKQTDDRKMWFLFYFSETPTPQLTELFETELDESPLEKGLYCLTGLGRIGTDKAVEVLSRHLDNEEWFFRKHLAAALGETNNKNAVEPLLSLLSDVSQQVQTSAVDSLSKVGNLFPEKIISKLNNCNKTEKVNLVRAMGKLKNKLFLKPLLNVLKDREMLFCSVDALGDLGFVEASDELINLLKDEIWFNRLNAIEALEKLNPPNLKQMASELMQDENDMVKNSATRIYTLCKTINN